MNRPNKRQHPPMNYNEQSSDSDSDDDDSEAYTSSDNDSEDEIEEGVANTVNVVEWKDVPPSFSPRKLIPENKEVETNCDANSTITELFLKLFPKSLFIWISECTNERLNILAEKTGKQITPTDPGEIMIVIGCLMIMSYNHVPHIYMYWSKNKTVRNETIATAISRDRFMLIHSKLYFNHPKKPSDAGKTYYMTEVVNCLLYTFNHFRSESTYQSIDEFMVKFKGRTSMKQYMPDKPVKRGVKGFCRADACTGYVYDFYIYQGKETAVLEGTLGERVCTSRSIFVVNFSIFILFLHFISGNVKDFKLIEFHYH